MYCSNCGTKIEEGNTFCTNCGQNIDGTPPQEPIQNNNPQTGNNPSQNSPVQGTAVASLIIGVIAVTLSFIISLFVLPLSIMGFVLGISCKQKSGAKTAGIILNSVSVLIGIIVLIIYVLFVASGGLFSGNENESPIVGQWDCKSYSATNMSDDYILSFELNNDLTFKWSDYNNSNNQVSGTYTHEKIEKENDNSYEYYNIKLTSTKYVINGEPSTEVYKSEYEIGVDPSSKVAIFMNANTNKMYYCTKNKNKS